jgi:hypothetical protein
VAVLVLLALAEVHADPAPRLEYIVGEDVSNCPTEREFRDAVAARLGADPFVPESPRRLVVEVRLENGELSATGAIVEANGGTAGLRRITGASGDCREIADGMALSVSLALNPALVGHVEDAANTREPQTPHEERPNETTKVSPPLPRLRPIDLSPSKPKHPASREEPLRLGGGFATHAALGVGPGVGAGVSLALFGRRGPWSLALEGRFDGLSTGMSFERRGGATTRLLAGMLAPCGSLGLAFVCALGLAGRIEGSSTGIRSPGTDSAPYAGAGGRLGLEWPWSSSVAVQGRLDVLVTLLPVRVQLGNESVWASPPTSGAFGIGMIGTLP